LASAEVGLAALVGAVAFSLPVDLRVSIVAGFGFSLFIAAFRAPILTLLIGRSDQHRGALTGLFATSNHLGVAVGAGIGGVAFTAFGSPAVGLLTAVFGLISAGLIVAARSVTAPSCGPRPPPSPPAAPPRP